jgi:dCMP deaminase
MGTQVLLYLPVVHQGYVALLEQYDDATDILLLGPGFADRFRTMRKEIRALPADLAARLVAGLTRATVRVVEPDDLPAALTAETLVLPDEEIMRDLASSYALGEGRELVWHRTFLRWDRPWSRPQPVDGLGPSAGVTDADRARLARARQAAEHSSDWWRQVGAVLVLADGTELEGYNRHAPTEHAPYLDGDPRNEFHRGERMDLSTALHAEAGLLARAAREGTSVAGGRMYVTTFPCPTCARMIAEAGLAACYFEAPYAVLAGDQVLRAAGVELHWIPPGEPFEPDQ